MFVVAFSVSFHRRCASRFRFALCSFLLFFVALEVAVSLYVTLSGSWRACVLSSSVALPSISDLLVWSIVTDLLAPVVVYLSHNGVLPV